MTFSRIHALIISLALAFSTSAFAMDDTKPKPEPKPEPKKELEQARAAIAKQDWAGAQAVLREAVQRNPQDADYHNLYAYSMRKGANPSMDLVFRHYNEALRLNAKHRGAHEYIGEAYLMTGNVAKAKDHLAQLERLCAAGCDERAALQREISLFERQHAAK
jgi:cytochrome c-type biogenesis protein CcmH/NrfG